MSAAHTRVPSPVVVLMELDPMSVYRKALSLIRRHPESQPLVAEVIENYNRFFDDLNDDCCIVGAGSAFAYSEDDLDLIERLPG